ncbi:8892_t:CDS:2 [Gigaspora rosea]|nr:8892_t:CDS:2 [Gigaspora rosea]
MSYGERGICCDTIYNPAGTPNAARMATGSVNEIVGAVASRKVANGFAIVRPLGHHAEQNQAMGFCYFNNVGIAANIVLKNYPNHIKKILIVDWKIYLIYLYYNDMAMITQINIFKLLNRDIHHGNGTQDMFYDHDDVLYLSLHRWDNGNFYSYSGSPSDLGLGVGLDKNVNITFSSEDDKSDAMGDTEYVAASKHIVMPIAI